jgi:hypothetical protein
MVGVNYGTFNIILEKLQKAFIGYQNEQNTRKRGKKCSLSIADQLLLTLLVTVFQKL